MVLPAQQELRPPGSARYRRGGGRPIRPRPHGRGYIDGLGRPSYGCPNHSGVLLLHSTLSFALVTQAGTAASSRTF